MDSSKKKLLLINPWIYDFAAYDLWSKPLGLLYIASFLREKGFSISFIDCLDKYSEGMELKTKKYGQGGFLRQEIEKPKILAHIPRRYARYGISENAFREKLNNLKDKPDAILVTSIMTYWYLGPKKVVKIVREVFPKIPVILGGIYATILPEHAKKEIKPDYIITGPGELKVLELLNKLFGINGKNISSPSNIDDYPYPAFDLIKQPDYLLIMTARGCPYDCSFCVQKKIAMPFVQRNPENVVKEISYHYKKFKLRDFAFYDDALFIKKNKHIKIILKKIIEQRLPVRLHSPNGLFANLIDEELACLMYKASFKTIRLSFETSNEERRKDMFKKISNKGMIQAVENLVKAGYKRHQLDAYVIMGLPGQTINEVLASMIFVNNLGVQVRLASFSPIPGTLDFQRAVEQKMIPQNIDPLLTNKSIFPLSNQKLTYDTFRKTRVFSQLLNDAAKKGFALFADQDISSNLISVVRNIH